MPHVVVVTGSSGGIGRASAVAFAARGDTVVLVARGEKGLAGAADQVRQAGGTAHVMTADVADPDEVFAVADRVEAEIGPIDVWVNVAFTSVFAPFDQIKPEEYRRVTEANYLGYTYGTMAALKYMKTRDRGTIVQVGSALAYRGIHCKRRTAAPSTQSRDSTRPCVASYCTTRATSTSRWFRCPPSTPPQFSWVLSRLPHHAQPVPPIYQPEFAARGVVFAADHPKRREYWVGASTMATLAGNAIAPGLLDRYLAKTGFKSQQTKQTQDPDAPVNLWNPADGEDGRDFGAHGAFDDQSHERDPQLWASHHHGLLAAVTDGAGAAAALLWRRR